MRKKLLAGVMALALCSTNMPPQTIFAGEFTSGNLEEVTEETPEIFSDDNQDVIEETEEELSVFSSENVPEFSSEVNIMSATADETEPIGIDMNDITNPNYYDSSKGIWKITSAGSYRFNGTGNNDAPILIDNIASGTVNIYLNNVNIETASGPALQITSTVQAQVCIYLENENNLITTNVNSAGLQKDNIANLTIDNSSGTSGILTAQNSAPYACGAGIGGGVNGSCSNITISGGSINASSSDGAGIGGGGIGGGMGVNGSCSNITINGGSVNASSSGGAGIGSGLGSGPEMVSSSCSNITISDGSVNASSDYGAGIGSGDATNRTGSCSNITISGGSVNASSSRGAGIGSGFCDMGNRGLCSNITISGGSVNAKIDCIPHQNLDSSGNYDPNSPNVYLCTIPNEGNDPITIDNTHWSPYSHIAVDSSEKKLYAWLTGEDHIVIVGPERRSYIFNSNEFNNTKRTVTSAIFEFNGSEFIYDGNTHSPNITTKNNIKGVGDFTVKYFKENDPTTEITEPKDVGTYIVKIDVNKGDFYNASSGYLTNDDWKFDIKPGTLTPTITNYTGEYDGKSHPIIKIDKDTIPKNSTIEYRVDNGQTWTTLNPLNPNKDIPTVSTVTEAKNTKICIQISNSNYETWTKEYNAEIRPAASTPNFPSPSDTKIPVPWSCKKVNEIAPSPLPANWAWQPDDAAKDLQFGNNSVTAVYTGKDKGNYNTETVTYTITREACKHPHTTERYYSSPSCTSSGYSGDTYCTDCGVLVSSGYTISAYGHDYDSGVITTEPTAETDGIITYTCKRCKHQDTKTLGKLGDGEPYIEGSFQKKGWDAVNDLIKASKEKDTISITLNGSRTLPASVLSGIKGKDISLNLDMENGFIWKINGTSITAETPADIDLSVTNTAEYIPVALYSLISTNQNDFGFHLGRSGAFDFPAVLSVKADASCAGLMANLFWYDAENGVLQCIQTVTVGGAFERSIPYADFTLSKGQDYFIAFGTESLNGRVIHTDGSITDEKGAYLRPANTKISSHSIDRNKLTVKLSKGCAGAQGYDFVISKKSNMLQTGKFSKTVSSTGKPQASFRYLAKGTWYVAARSWVLDEQGNKVYGSWTKIKKIKITVVTPQQPKIRNITVEGNTVTITYTKCKNATGYEILLGNKYKTSAGEKYPVKKYLKRTEGKNTVTVTFTNVKKGTWYVTVRSWNKTSKNKSRVYSPYSDIKKFKVKK